MFMNMNLIMFKNNATEQVGIGASLPKFGRALNQSVLCDCLDTLHLNAGRQHLHIWHSFLFKIL
jgi:hypothetical protein